MIPPLYPKSARDWYRPGSDVMGVVASGACAAHCVMAAVLPPLFPVTASRLPSGDGVHGVFAALVVLTSLMAFVPGWLRHGEPRVWGWALAGLGLISYTRWAGPAEVGPIGDALLTTSGGVVLIVAHRLNHSLAYWCDRI
ncbi:MAG: MerC domain-containing protein [Verrucomicrobiales bacterium]|nr:MerC domain-containing protein [Verrucomicrobiales bacterium]